MKVFQGLSDLGMVFGCAVAIGNFDGVHRGHQAVIEKLKSEAGRRGVPSCVLTFDPHPRNYFALLTGQKVSAVSHITSNEEKLAALARYGVEQVVVLPFDRQLASRSSESFIEAVLIRGLCASYVIVGDDFHFGTGRSGNFNTLAAAGNRFGFDAECMPEFTSHGARISSTIIRRALEQGDIAMAENLLGRELTTMAQKFRLFKPETLQETIYKNSEFIDCMAR